MLILDFVVFFSIHFTSCTLHCQGTMFLSVGIPGASSLNREVFMRGNICVFNFEHFIFATCEVAKFFYSV